MSNDQNDIDLLKQKLVSWFERQMPGAEDISIPFFEKPGMGLSSETILFDLKWKQEGQDISEELVLRSAPIEHKVFPEYAISHQYKIMDILHETDIPVPHMRWLEEDSLVIGAPFFIMERLDGAVPQDYPSYHGSGMYYEDSPANREKMWWGSIESMAKIHALDWEKMGFSFLGKPGRGTGPIDRQLAYWDRFFEWIKDSPEESHPTIEASMQWLKENRYVPEYISLCWGDARMGNTFYSKPDRDVLAVMDWEMAYIGDPEADLAWTILLDWQQSAGAGLPRLKGTPTYDETVVRYEELSGRKVKNLFYNEIFSAVRYGMILVSVLKKFRKKGIPIEEDMLLNNVCTQRLAELLKLPSPGEKREETGDLKERTVSLQFNFTGPEGYNWYLISERGQGSRHKGTIENPDCAITVSLQDWTDIQQGKLDRLEAWSSGRLVTTGDLNIMILLEDMIKEFTEN